MLERQGARLVAAYEAGARIPDLAARAGIGATTLREYLAAEGVKFRHSRGQWREVLEARGAELIAAYEGGRALNALAAGAGVSAGLLRQYLVDHGVAIRTKRGQAWDLLEARAPELIAAYEAGATLRVLAVEAGVSPRTISAFLIAQGVRLRYDRAWSRRRRRADG